MIKKKIFIICTVRGASEEYRKKLEDYVKKLEDEGHEIHLPHRDTNQNATSLEICMENKDAIKKADEIHIFYNSKSTGTHFDMGMAFAFDKKIVIVENEYLETYDENGKYKKSFPAMLTEWVEMFKLYFK